MRFAMPENSICLACSAIIDAGTRFNAVKKPFGDYLGIKSWEFHINCLSCKARAVVVAHPKEGYIFKSGLKPQSSATSAEMIPPVEDPMTKAEVRRIRDSTLVLQQKNLRALREQRKRRYEDDFGSNAILHKMVEPRMKEARLGAKQGKEMSLGMPLLPSKLEDSAAARAKMRAGERRRLKSARASVDHRTFLRRAIRKGRRRTSARK